MALPGFQYTDLNIGVETVDPIKRVVQYVDFNIGLEAADQRDAVGYADFNIGLEKAPRVGAEYSDFNIHLATSQYKHGVYLDFNIDPNETPVPHIWYVRPQYGKEGLLFNIYGQGFGVTQGEFDGKVVLNGIECTATQWQLIPAYSTKALRVGAGMRSNNIFVPLVGSGTSYIPGSYHASLTTRVANTSDPSSYIVLAAGDVVEFDLVNRTNQTPLAEDLYFYPVFQKFQANGSIISWTQAALNNLPSDQEGRGWFSRLPHLYGQVQHRRFVIPGNLNGVRTGNWGVGVAGKTFEGRPVWITDFTKFVIRSSDGTVKRWVTADDGSPVRLGFTSSMNTPHELDGLSSYSAFTQVDFVNTPIGTRPFFIDDGATNVEHEWIVAVVPESAESGMVRVVLEDG